MDRVAATDEVRIAKQALRREMRLRRRAFSPAAALRGGQDAAALVGAACARWSAARRTSAGRELTVLLYAALPGELATGPIDGVLRGLGACVAYPRVDGDELMLHRAEPAALSPGCLSIPEPAAHADPIEPHAIDVAFVPGVAFDTGGRRLGHGRSYYDRLLARSSRALRIGVCLPFQVVARVPTEPHDLPMDYLLVGDPDGAGTLTETHTRVLDAIADPKENH